MILALNIKCFKYASGKNPNNTHVHVGPSLLVWEALKMLSAAYHKTFSTLLLLL